MNETTRLSKEGQITIPQDLLETHHWKAGQGFIIIDTGNGLLLKPKEKPFPETTLNQVAGCLNYHGKPKSLDEIEEAVGKGIVEQWHDRS